MVWRLCGDGAGALWRSCAPATVCVAAAFPECSYAPAGCPLGSESCGRAGWPRPFSWQAEQKFPYTLVQLRLKGVRFWAGTDMRLPERGFWYNVGAGWLRCYFGTSLCEMDPTTWAWLVWQPALADLWIQSEACIERASVNMHDHKTSLTWGSAENTGGDTFISLAILQHSTWRYKTQSGTLPVLLLIILVFVLGNNLVGHLQADPVSLGLYPLCGATSRPKNRQISWGEIRRSSFWFLGKNKTLLQFMRTDSTHSIPWQLKAVTRTAVKFKVVVKCGDEFVFFWTNTLHCSRADHTKCLTL